MASNLLFRILSRELLNIPLPSLFIPVGYATIAIVTTLVCTAKFTADVVFRPNPPTITQPETYDFIIVGGGSAGAVVANRLSENARWKVLLLEAGDTPLILNSIPGLLSGNMYHKDTDWNYFSVPQKNCSYTSLNQKIGLSRGKSLGGSSNLNFMIYQRGNPKDYDNWANITGDKSWNYKNLLKYFKISEDYHGNFPDPLGQYHGSGGPLTISKLRNEPLVKQWVAAAEELGFNITDPNAEQTSTFSPIDTTTKNGQRDSTYNAFLRNAMNRKNLNVVRYAVVDKILMSGKNATGVVYIRHGKKIEVQASKEIILCAGVFGSPSILQRSGIGPRHLLESLKIPVVHDLPGVGEGLQDHVMTVAGPILLNDSVSFMFDDIISPGTLLKYARKRLGPLTFIVVSGVGFFSTSEPKNPDWPNICVFLSPMGMHASFAQDIARLFALERKLLEPYYNHFKGHHATQVFINLGRPESRGSVKIKSSDPDVPPDIDPNYYSDAGGKDIRAMIEAFKFIIKYFTTTTPWMKLGANPNKRHFPGCENFQLRSDEYYECHIRHFTGSSWHSCCTNQMGPDGEQMAVVDSNLRVRGVKKIRVIDASIMPIISNANLNAPTIMIGEKGASLLLQEWGY
ncbi:oxygen-dependent choline dehydrogenase isoform X2 [Folsomia candida]|nr:oxygen-dependent choline dehydrogenase isoform X2 [Folsomia candida]